LICLEQVRPGKARSGHLTNHRGWTPWAKGKTKETDKRLAKISRARRRALKLVPIEVLRERAKVLMRPEVRAKALARATATRRAQFERGERVAFGGTGNGGRPPKSEIAVASMLKQAGFKHGMVVPMGREYPNHYKLDFGNARLKIAVEIDGSSHNSSKVKTADARKDKRLAAIGWEVVRFEATNDLSKLRAAVSRWLAQMSNVTG
jgi:very-short-patch-repair endonuclease